MFFAYAALQYKKCRILLICSFASEEKTQNKARVNIRYQSNSLKESNLVALFIRLKQAQENGNCLVDVTSVAILDCSLLLPFSQSVKIQ